MGRTHFKAGVDVLPRLLDSSVIFGKTPSFLLRERVLL